MDAITILKRAYGEYNNGLTKLWKGMLETYRYSHEFAFGILEGWNEEESAETFEEEWMAKADELRDKIEKKYGVHIEHDDDFISVIKSGMITHDGKNVENA